MTTDIALPPLLTLHAIVSDADPFEAACVKAATGERGAGDVVFAAADVLAARIAIVLEPEVSALQSRQMLVLAAVALADALGALLPPKVAIEHRWPGTLLLNGAAGPTLSMRMAEANGDTPPCWLVLGVEVPLALPEGSGEIGTTPDRTVLAEEGGVDVTSAAVLQSFAARFLSWLDVWQERGFEPVTHHWLFRAEGRTSPVPVRLFDETVVGRVLGLDEAANLRLALAEGDSERTLDLAAAMPVTSDGTSPNAA